MRTILGIALVFVVCGAIASTYCVRLDPRVVCTELDDCYNTSDCKFDCDGIIVNVVGQCVGTSGDADDSVANNIFIAADDSKNLHCWCALTQPVASKWVMRYTYRWTGECLENCSRGCRNAFVYDNEQDISFRDTMYSNLVE